MEEPPKVKGSQRLCLQAQKTVCFWPSGDGSSTTASTTARSTTSGSTASHGPRFKRYRLPATGTKEVPDLDVHSRITDEINHHTSEAGWAIMDSRATRTVCGTKVWDKLAEEEGRRATKDIQSASMEFRGQRDQLRFLDEMDDEKPLHVMVAFECRPWSPMQIMNYRADERKKQLAEMRAVEERTHLKFYSEIHKKGREIGREVTLEQPAEAMSWKASTLGYFETVLDRCRTGLKLNPKDVIFVKKPTRFRTSTRIVA